MAKHFIEVPQKQRLDCLGELNEATQHVWLALHGYGQLVEYFQRHFREMATAHRAFVFPQGAHKFYLQGTEGRVGASWMTKEDRLTDIANQRMYLQEVMRWAQEQAPNATFHMVGFSQGVATGMRFIGHCDQTFHSLLAWAGSWPPDLDAKGIAALAKMEMSAWFGTEDPFVTDEKVREKTELYNSEYRLYPKVNTYAGAHKFDHSILAQEIGRLEQRTQD